MKSPFSVLFLLFLTIFVASALAHDDHEHGDYSPEPSDHPDHHDDKGNDDDNDDEDGPDSSESPEPSDDDDSTTDKSKPECPSSKYKIKKVKMNGELKKSFMCVMKMKSKSQKATCTDPNDTSTCSCPDNTTLGVKGKKKKKARCYSPCPSGAATSKKMNCLMTALPTCPEGYMLKKKKCVMNSA